MAFDDIPFTEEVSLPPSTDRRMARAMVAWTFRQGRVYAIVGCLSGLMALIFYFRGYADASLSRSSQIFASVFWAAVFAAVLALAFAAVVYFSNLRVFRQTARPGSVMRTGFGTEEFVTSNDLSSSRFSYEAVRSVDTAGDFVLIRYAGSPVISVYPSELFPADALQRLEHEAAAAG